jgi:hypothetical protein
VNALFDPESYDLFCAACGLVITVGLWWFGLSRMLRRKPKLRFRMWLCRRCGYDLRASKGRCPECGAITRVPPHV